MSVCYFLGAKKVTSKKSGKDYFPCTFLSQNSWGDWETFHKFCDGQETFTNLVSEISVGIPVIVALDMVGNVTNCVPNDDIPPIDLYMEGGVN